MLSTIVMRFLDTNILLYRISSDPGESPKRRVAEALLECRDLLLSVQVLQEFYVQATRSSRCGRLKHSEAIRLIQSWQRYSVLPVTVELMESALLARERWQLSYWDAAIIEAARAGNCEVVLSEDLQHGQDFAGVRVVNPFRDG